MLGWNSIDFLVTLWIVAGIAWFGVVIWALIRLVNWVTA